MTSNEALSEELFEDELLNDSLPTNDPQAPEELSIPSEPTALPSEANADIAHVQQTANLVGSFKNILINNFSNISLGMQSLLDRDFSTGVDEIALADLEALNTNIERIRNIALGGQQIFSRLSQPGSASFDVTAFSDFTSGSIDFEELLAGFGSSASDMDLQDASTELPPLADNSMLLTLDSNNTGAFDGELETGEVEDVFVFDIEDSEQRVVLEAESDSFDTTLAIFNENEELIFENDDLVAVDGEEVENQFNRRIVADLTPGRYFTAIQSFLEDELGAYRFSIPNNDNDLPITPMAQVDPDIDTSDELGNTDAALLTDAESTEVDDADLLGDLA